MGGIVSARPSVQSQSSLSARRTTVWKKQESFADMKARFVADGSLPPDVSDEYIELRQILSEPVCQRYLGDFAKKQFSQETFFSWIDIQEYRSIPTYDYRRSKLTHIYKKYIKADSILNLGCIEDEEREGVRELVERAREDKKILTNSSLNSIQHKIFMDMYKSTFLPFRLSEHYKAMKSEMNEVFNHVTMEDFDLFEKLGEGGFAKVVRVRKRTTGKYYALKVQRKKDLVEMYLDDPTRLETEKTVFAACHHPFIVNLDYALQSRTCALLVLSLANAGNLQDMINTSASNRVPSARVVFYAAEVVLALGHLHDLKMMYRDLKPSNVLLCEDGHIQLADMGGVADCGGSVLSKGDHDPRLMKDRQGKGRRRSIMGTHGYMAPEMVKLMGQKRYERVGYTELIDYWSLGVTIFKLLCGTRPFDKKKFEKIRENQEQQDKDKTNKEYEMLKQEIVYPSYFTKEEKSFIEGLLKVEESERLGSKGVDDLKGHPYFSNIDWDKLIQKHVIPPFMPAPKMYPTRPAFHSFEDMLSTLAKERLASGQEDVDWKEGIDGRDVPLFDTWDFISPHTLKVEMGIAGEMEAHDTNFKVQQVMGGAVATSPSDQKQGLVGRVVGSLSPKVVSQALSPQNKARRLSK
mmetsp:Transcript_15900/g.31632  ORF Transcript_15900/g.31632 Transcript_15900/m.31632 type:complete len:635 (+) Transcript_15900:244-2148(+)